MLVASTARGLFGDREWGKLLVVVGVVARCWVLRHRAAPGMGPLLWERGSGVGRVVSPGLSKLHFRVW